MNESRLHSLPIFHIPREMPDEEARLTNRFVTFDSLDRARRFPPGLSRSLVFAISRATEINTYCVRSERRKRPRTDVYTFEKPIYPRHRGSFNPVYLRDRRSQVSDVLGPLHSQDEGILTSPGILTWTNVHVYVRSIFLV